MNGDRNDPFVQAEFAEIEKTIRLEKELSNQGWAVFLETPGNRKRLLLIVLVSFFSQCSGNGLVSYYLHDILQSVGITEPKDQSLFNGGLQIWSFLVAISFSVFLVDKFGRKLLFMIAGVGMLLVFSAWTGCSAVYAETGNKGAGKAVMAMIFLFYGVAGFAWPGLTVSYCSEILPFNIRGYLLPVQISYSCPGQPRHLLPKPPQHCDPSVNKARISSPSSLHVDISLTFSCFSGISSSLPVTSYGLSTCGYSCRDLQAFLGMTSFALKQGKREQ